MRNINSKFMNLILIGMLVCSCAPKNSEDKTTTMPTPTVVDYSVLCNTTDDSESMTVIYNSEVINNQLSERKNVFSGTAIKLTEKFPGRKLINNYSGLVPPCEELNEKLVIGCQNQGEIEETLFNGKVQKISLEVLSTRFINQYKSVMICGELTINVSKPLFIFTRELNIHNLSLNLKKGSITSISAIKINDINEFKEISQDDTTVLSIHSSN